MTRWSFILQSRKKVLQKVMEMLNHFLFALFICLLSLAVLVDAQDQSEFISLDCGLPKDSNYSDSETGINYISDAAFIETGTGMTLSKEFDTVNLQQQLWYVRSFPDQDIMRNCYNLKIKNQTKYLIRATFMFGNYDPQGKLPIQFELHLGANLWDTVRLDNASSVVMKEIIHVSSMDYIYVCLVNTGLGTPFISALEFRPLNNNIYEAKTGSLVLFERLDAAPATNQIVRYPDDVYDRIWMPYNSDQWAKPSNSTFVAFDSHGSFQPPSTVMRTAASPANASEPLLVSFYTANPISQFYVFMHFTEPYRNFQVNQTREFKIFLNGVPWYQSSVITVYGNTNTVFSTTPLDRGRNQFSIKRTENSTLPPILNAIEAYTERNFLQSQTDQNDVDAIMKIKSTYGLMKRNWQGDPCVPQPYLWNGLGCNYNDYDPPRIVSLNLSSSGLTGNIASSLINLRLIQYLDLSDNHLNGSVPEFLAKMPSLRILNLDGNNLTGSVPVKLIERSNNGSLKLSYDRNPYLCCQKKKKKKTNKIIIPLVASAATLLILIIPLAIWWRFNGNIDAATVDNIRNDSLELKSRRYAYSDILSITDNFKRVLGKGGFGIVYHGYLDDTEVAVKMLSSSSSQGYKEFQAEVKLLLRVHHRNLTNLVGYCKEGTNMGLVYEYMANGNLQQHLSERIASVLSWEGRLQIAMDAAQGLEYLHHGCKPPIVHRDIKPANILLNEKFDAKLADFGLSKIFMDGDTHMSTVVAGTLGYLDPEYYVTNRLNEKSDVYSFGIVLLEIITSRPVVKIGEDENVHITRWVIDDMIGNGDITMIVDPILEGDFDTNSAWKAVELALACASHVSSKRPAMNDVVMELKECLAMETARKKNGRGSEANSSA